MHDINSIWVVDKVLYSLFGSVVGSLIVALLIFYYYVWRRPVFYICPFLVFDEQDILVNVICTRNNIWRPLRWTKRKGVSDVKVTGFLVMERTNGCREFVDLVFKSDGYIPQLYGYLLLRMEYKNEEFLKQLKGIGIIENREFGPEVLGPLLESGRVRLKIFATYTDPWSGSRLAKEVVVKTVFDSGIGNYSVEDWLKYRKRYLVNN